MPTTARYHQPKLDPQTRDFVLDKGGRLLFVQDSDAVKQTAWMRIVSRLSSFVYDRRYGSRLWETLRYGNIEAVRLLARSFIVAALRLERNAGRITAIKEVSVESIDPRSRVNWGLSFETEFDQTVHLSS